MGLFDVTSPAQSFTFKCQLESGLLNPPVLDITDLWQSSWKSCLGLFFPSVATATSCAVLGTELVSLSASEVLSHPLGWLLLIYTSLGLSFQEGSNLQW